jgi:putative photosynthetic complex assembly protein 2
MQDYVSLIIEPALFALVSWWFGTGIILLLVRLPKAWFALARGGWTLLSIGALFFCVQSMQDNSVANAYLGFISTIVIWGWHELAFLTGWISGPRKTALEDHLPLGGRFKQSVEVIWHHELALVLNFLLLIALQMGNPNHTALCTFALLWLMRLSSKFNLFFGVPQVGEQYLPTQLAYLGSYFRKKPVGVFFYCTLGVSIVSWLGLIWQAFAGQVSITSQWVLLASLLGLAILEHVLMMIPYSLERVWNWALKSNKTVYPNPENLGCTVPTPEENIVIPMAHTRLIGGSGVDAP